jgi:predicted Fe-S protein YdhL (DUF1289 family)
MLEKKLFLESPCISVCEVDPETKVCRGCWRSLGEIKIWPTSSNNIKLEILRKARKRKIDAGQRIPRRNKRSLN